LLLQGKINLVYVKLKAEYSYTHSINVTTTTTTILQPFFHENLGEPVPENDQLPFLDFGGPRLVAGTPLPFSPLTCDC